MVTDLAHGWRGESVLLLFGNSLRVLSADGVRVVRECLLPKPYARVRERKLYYVALDETSVDLLEKVAPQGQPLRVQRSIAIKPAPDGVYDLLLHPVDARSFAT